MVIQCAIILIHYYYHVFIFPMQIPWKLCVSNFHFAFHRATPLQENKG